MMITEQQIKVARMFASGEPGAQAGFFGADMVEAMKRVRYQPLIGGHGVHSPSHPDGFDTRTEAEAFAAKVKTDTIRWMRDNNVV